MSIDSLRLTGKTAIVTGGSRGIGAACARLLAARGAVVAVTHSSSPGRADGLVKSIITNGAAAFAMEEIKYTTVLPF